MAHIENVTRTVVRKLLSYLILAMLKKEEQSIYKLMEKVQEEFKVILSTGTVYNVVYSLERKGFIQKNVATATYKLTNSGLVVLDKAKTEIRDIAPKIEAFIKTA